MRHCQLHPANRGFTLIEIMVVVVILGILASLVVPSLMDRPDQARLIKLQNDLQTISTALDLYKMDNHVLPTMEQGLEALIKKPVLPPIPTRYSPKGYLKRVPMDPWDRPYLYRIPGQHREFDVYTLGADGKENGSGMDQDIGQWMLK